MKALAISSEGLEATLPAVTLVADSAIARQHDPVWLDTEADAPAMTALICPAYRIGRLGKHIAERFAMRYVDAATVVMLSLPEQYADCPDRCPTACLLHSATLVLGNDFESEPGTLPAALRLDSANCTVDVDAAGFITKAVSRLSRLTILKNGDRLIDLSHPIKVALSPGSYVTASLDGQPALKVKIL